MQSPFCKHAHWFLSVSMFVSLYDMTEAKLYSLTLIHFPCATWYGYIIGNVSVIALSPNLGHMVLHVVFLTSFHCDVTTAQALDGPFDCDVKMKKSANKCDVGPLGMGQFQQGLHACIHHTFKTLRDQTVVCISIKLWIYVHHDKRMNPIDFLSGYYFVNTIEIIPLSDSVI